MNLPFHKKIVLSVVNAFAGMVVAPVMRWCALGAQNGEARSAVLPGSEYIEPSSLINPLVILAALEDQHKQVENDPVNEQARLNACLSSLRSERINSHFLGFYLSLIQQGYPPDEAILRLLANALNLGMAVQARLGVTSASADARSTNQEQTA
jgi:hypothetical protein